LSQAEERAFYAQKAVQNGWTHDMLVNQIESGLLYLFWINLRKRILDFRFSDTAFVGPNDKGRLGDALPMQKKQAAR